MTNHEIQLMIHKLNLKSGYMIAGTAALQLRNIKGFEEVPDVDVVVDNYEFERLLDICTWKDSWYRRTELGDDVVESAELCCIWKDNFYLHHIDNFTKVPINEYIKGSEIIDGLRVLSIRDLIKWKTIIARDKDIKHVIALAREGFTL